jgi:O-antigen/teichoic acid export membrane protein
MTASKASVALSSDRQLAVSIGRNTIFGVLASAVQVGTRFVMVPLVIYHLGLGGYGIWSVVMGTAGYMRFGSAGLKSAFQKYVAEATGTGDFQTANKLLSTGSISMLLLSLAGLIPLAIYSQKLAKVSGVPPEFLSAAAGSITILAVILAIANFGAVFEAIVMGGHRIDLTRQFTMITTTGEAVAIITLLHFGYGLFAMAATIAVSELVYVFCCFLASRRVVPEIHISPQYFTSAVFKELFRFAASYQLVNILEVLYGMLVPVTMLKYFGAEIAGVYAVATRLVGAALMGQDALILPLLSGGTMMYTSGSTERLQRFLRKPFKVTFTVPLFPLAFVGTFGSLLVLAWTRQSSPEFRITIFLACLAAVFNAISRLQLILYRASGNALHDNIRQAFRLGVLAVLAIFGGVIGYHGILLGLAVAELVGVVYMVFAMTSALSFFNPQHLLSDTMRLIAATAVMLATGVAVTLIPTPLGMSQREAVLIKLGEVSLACLIACWPALAITKSMSTQEQRTLLHLFAPWRRAATALIDG